MAFKWYIVKAYSGHEKKVKDNIEKAAASRGLSDYLGEVSIPMIRVAEMRKGKKRIVKKKFMPGYLLAQLDLTKGDLIYTLKNVPSCGGLVGSPTPKSLTDEEVQNIMQSEASDTNKDESVTPHVLFQIGERVKIVDGAFANFTGVVDEIMHDKGKLRVKVEIFGQATAVELEFLQVSSSIN